MAAAETATAAGGTRRPVIRSERFVQWQRQLSSTRRAPYGSRKRNDGGNIQAHQKESEDGNETKEFRDMEAEEAGENSALHNETLNVRVTEQQQQGSLECKKIKREISPECKKDGLLISLEGDLCSGQQNQLGAQQVCQQWQEQQQEPASAVPVKRRRQRAPKDQESQPSRRSAGGDAIAAMDLPSSNIAKRSTRLLARTLRTEEPLPPPLKLPKLHVVLSRKEVQEDWLQMTGRRYTGKPRKSTLIHLGLGLCTSLTCPSTIRYLTDP